MKGRACRRFSSQEEPRSQFESAINCPPELPFNHTVTRAELEDMGKAMDDNAKITWANLGIAEHLRPYRRPPKWIVTENQ
jgi:hypothetical protein